MQTRFILCTMLVISSVFTSVQATDWNEIDSLVNKEDQMVQVVSRKVAQKDLLGGVSVVNVEEPMKKNYNTYSLDNMQGYVGGWNGNSLWGMDGDNAGHLVSVDDVPRDVNNVMLSEIAQTPFLKGAQAVALYGSKAAKGIAVITTKRDNVEGLNVSIRANTGAHVAKAYPEYLGPAEYMTLYNETFLNDDPTVKPLYTAEQIYNHGPRLNFYRYPSINYYSSDYVKKAYNRSEVAAEITGGGKHARLYSNASYYRNDDFPDFGGAKNNMTGRFNVCGNVDVDINSFTSTYINANVTSYNSRSAKGDYWNTAAAVRPNFSQNATPLTPLDMIGLNASAVWELLSITSNITDGKYLLSGSQINPTNTSVDSYAAGGSKWTSRQFQSDTGVNVNLDKVLKGLSFNAIFAVDYATSYPTSLDSNYAVFIPTWANYGGKDVIVALTKEDNDEKPGTQNVGGSSDKQMIAFSGQFNCQNTLKKHHNVSAMLIANGYQQTVSAQYRRTSNANSASQLGYNYRQRYYANFGAALIHSAKPAEGHRQTPSPSLTLGWRLSGENFLKDSPVADDLLFNVFGNILSQDIDSVMGDREFYLYESVWTQNDGYSWYDGPAGKYTIFTRGQNKDLSFVERKEFSASLRTSLQNRLITADASFFINSTEGYLISQPIFLPSHLNTGYPAASFMAVMNYNNNRRMGFDFSVNANKCFGEFDLSFGVSGTYYDTKVIKCDEIYDDVYRYRRGKPVNGVWEFQSVGLFQSEEEVKNSPEQKLGSTVRPGDIKYADQNGDDVIDEKGEIYLGKGGWYGSPFTLGVNFTAKWKNFTLFALDTGGFGAYSMKNNSYYWVDGDDKYSATVRNRWIKETAATATYLRLLAKSSSNNFRSSDYWLYKTNRFDLAKAQITYDLPKRVLRNTFLCGFSVYVSGANLLIISKERKHMEMNVGSAPQTRFYNIGVKAIF